MGYEVLIKLEDIADYERIEFAEGVYVEKEKVEDCYGRAIHLLWISNGVLSFSVILERGMDIGEIFVSDEKISWEKDRRYLLHPDSVNLKEEKGWEKGFYSAVTALGPEIFGTPDKVRSMHGTGSYSKTDMSSVRITWDRSCITLEGTVPIKGFEASCIYEKKIRYITFTGSMAVVREDITKNLTNQCQPIDDGYHVQLAGQFMSEGGRYVLPVSVDRVLLRDQAPKETHPFEIYDFQTVLNPIRCYQYIPEEVRGLDEIEELKEYAAWIESQKRMTAEMIVDRTQREATFVIRPLNSFSRSLLAKRNIEEPMYALEPCRTRPNSLRQKAIDGELCYIEPYAKMDSWIIFGVWKDAAVIAEMKKKVEKAIK